MQLIKVVIRKTSERSEVLKYLFTITNTFDHCEIFTMTGFKKMEKAVRDIVLLRLCRFTAEDMASVMLRNYGKTK